ncbi:MAG: nitronate monooxygenase [Phycisphaerales bacterium]|nr:nitronate monooxygenase [Phycisphaerales bacterium]
MGVGVSDWKLARAVSGYGQLGVVSGTGIATVLARRLGCGDVDGHMRRAAAAFPQADVAKRVLDRYLVAGAGPSEGGYKSTPMPMVPFNQALTELTVLAAFIEVYLAKEGHNGLVGLNLLEKVQPPTLPTLFGAMLAGVDYVLMGAGIPRFIPGALDAMAQWQAFDLRLDVEGLPPGQMVTHRFDPSQFASPSASVGTTELPALRRPAFLAIVSSATLALTLARKSNGRVDGFVVEGSIAGGHNAPPRGAMALTDEGEPIYGLRDDPDFKKIAEIGLPFYLAGGFGTPAKLAAARRLGAAGVQVGTAFAFCQESGITPEIKARVMAMVRSGTVRVFTDPRASPTGFPFKVVSMDESISNESQYANRLRRCDLGYLRRIYQRSDGTLGYRCAAEPVDDYVAKGGLLEETQGRKCLCNALFATIGLAQCDADGLAEAAIVTAGNDVAQLHRYLPPGADVYRAADVLNYMFGNSPPLEVEPCHTAGVSEESAGVL